MFGLINWVLRWFLGIELGDWFYLLKESDSEPETIMSVWMLKSD